MPVVADFNGGNAKQLLRSSTILVDGTDNFETRYLINDFAVKNEIPWVYGGVIASYGMTMTIRPGVTPCLRCVFPDPPEPGSAPTCDTAGVIGPAVHAVAAIQVAEIMKIAIGEFDSLNTDLLAVDVWELLFDRVPLDAPRPDCPTCGCIDTTSSIVPALRSRRFSVATTRYRFCPIHPQNWISIHWLKG